MLPNFAVLPPEVNSARVFAGAGSAPMLAAAAAWDDLASELHCAAMSFGSVTSGLVVGWWQGSASAAMVDAAASYIGWLSTSAAHAEGAAGLARAAVSVFEEALAATVHPAMVAANRAQVASLVASNLFGQNAPAIAALESLYEWMWAQDAAAMAGYYVGASAVATQLASWLQRLQSIPGAASLDARLPSSAEAPMGVVRAVNSAIAANAAAAQTVGLVMGGSGTPIPSARYVELANALYMSGSVPGVIAQALVTPQGLYPVVVIKNLTFDSSVAQGAVILESAIRQQIAAGNNVTVFGYSQSATISSLVMANLAASADPPSPDELSFTLIGNPNNPNGGVATRFPGISFPSLGVTATGATPHNLYPTKIYTIEYDGVADFPRYPLNFVSTLNAIAGIRTENLPLLEPLRSVPIVGNPLANLVQPNLKVIVNLGYGDPAYGYSTSPPNVATPFGLFPEVSPVVIADALAAGTQQGIGDFAYDVSHLELPLPADGSTMPSTAPGSGTPVPPLSIDSLIDDLQVANRNLANTISKVAATSYATVLPTADIANAALTIVPSYNIHLFLEGIQQALKGDPMGLVNAVGYPLAADVALFTAAGGLQLLIIISAGRTIANDISAIVP